MNRIEAQEYLKSRGVFRINGNLNTAFINRIDSETLSIINEYYGNTVQEKIWNIFNDRPVCEICGKPTDFINFNTGYKKVCSKECRNKYASIKNKAAWDNLNKEAIQKKREETNLRKYGVKNPGSNKEIQEKMKRTNLEKYGEEYYFATKDSQEKIKKNQSRKIRSRLWIK